MPNMSQYIQENFPKNISINVGAKYSFKSYQKMMDWCDAEIAFFTGIGNPGNIVQTFTQQIKNQLQQKFNQNRNEGFEWEDFSNEIVHFIETTISRQGIITERSKEGKFLSKLHTSKPHLVAGAFQYFQQKATNNNANINQRDGEFAAYLFQIGVEPNFEEEKQKYEEFYNEITEQKDTLLAELIEVKQQNTELNAAIETQKQSWDNIFKEQQEAAGKKFDAEYERHSSKMAESEKFYESELAFKKAVSYWTNKAKGHKTNSIIFGVAAGILMILTLCTIYKLGQYIVGLDITDAKGIGKRILTDSGALQIWVYAFFIVSLTIIVWIIRLLVKVFLSNLHLLSDAKERETMIMTYLALEREEQVLKKEDKELILPSIFRTSSHGIIKDDSSPNPIMNIMTKNPGS